MAILGRIDARALTDTVTVAAAVAPETRSVVTLDAQTPAGNNFNGTGNNAVDQGDLLLIGGVSYYIEAVTSDTTLLVHTDAAPGAGLAATRRTAPKEVAEYFAKGGDSATYQLLGVDLAEAQDPGSRDRGITTPGWWLYRTYVDSAGSTRHKAECIASFKAATVVIGDAADDPTVGEVDSIITINTLLPADAAGTETVGTATFTIQPGALSTPPGDATLLSFQWQRKAVGGRWSNISAATTDTLSLTGLTVAANDGDQYRVKVNASNGAPEVISRAATLTVTP